MRTTFSSAGGGGEDVSRVREKTPDACVAGRPVVWLLSANGIRRKWERGEGTLFRASTINGRVGAIVLT